MNRIIFILATLLIITQGLVAQELTCPAVVEMAVESTHSNCDETGRNQVCSGSGPVSLTATGESGALAEPGAMVAANTLQSVESAALDVETGSLGIVITRLQADLRDPAQSVLVALVGDVRLENAVAQQIGDTLDVTATGGINVRGGPSTNDPIIGGLARGQTVVADARLASGDWLRIQMPAGEPGWVFARLVTAADSINSLGIISDPALPTFTPLQAMRLVTGLSALPCREALVNGLLMQTPLDTGPAHLVVNGADLALSGTFYLEARADLVLYTLEGSALVTSAGASQRLVAGAQVRVALDNDSLVTGVPRELAAYSEATVAALPLGLLGRAIELVPALSAQQIEALMACQVIADNNINLRAGPGTNYPVLNTLAADTIAIVSGQAEGAEGYVWWQLLNTAWVRSDVVQVEGRCDRVPAVEAPSVIAPTPVQSHDVTYYMNACSVEGERIMAGQDVLLFVAGGGGMLLGEARQSLSGLRGSITIDGVPLVVVGFRTHRWGPDDYGVKIAGIWTATAGRHQINGTMSLFGGTSASCTVTVP